MKNEFHELKREIVKNKFKFPEMEYEFDDIKRKFHEFKFEIAEFKRKFVEMKREIDEFKCKFHDFKNVISSHCALKNVLKALKTPFLISAAGL